MTDDTRPDESSARPAADPANAVRVALITGASRGLGAALAEALAGAGWHVVAVARTTGALEELDDRVQASGGVATLAPMDITQDDAMRHLCRSIHERWGRVDLWAHTAVHAPPLSPAGHVAAKDWERTLNTTLRATGSLIPMIEPLLRASPAGMALFFDDPARLDAEGRPRKFFGAYGAAKAGQMALVQSWAAECAALGPQRAPRVMIDHPAPMPTATRARFFPGEDRTALSTPATEAARLMRLLD
ncbi:MAG: SDR family NAD(P)-dependent oxidoreductase [Pararhodobacter sp.]